LLVVYRPFPHSHLPPDPMSFVPGDPINVRSGCLSFFFPFGFRSLFCSPCRQSAQSLVGESHFHQLRPLGFFCFLYRICILLPFPACQSWMFFSLFFVVFRLPFSLPSPFSQVPFLTFSLFRFPRSSLNSYPYCYPDCPFTPAGPHGPKTLLPIFLSAPLIRVHFLLDTLGFFFVFAFQKPTNLLSWCICCFPPLLLAFFFSRTFSPLVCCWVYA